ncbi:MAG: enoyl-CoA hydratase-related protein [Propionicimonas sp.]|nr:enoyl-CoA hydratase-related protein [Propionicimonas sp.]
MSDTILLSVDDGLARLTLNRPAALNAMNTEMGTRWRDLAARVSEDPAVGVVLIDAAGGAFCAGGDVVEMATSGATGTDVTRAAGVIHEGILRFTRGNKPVVAAVQGAVAGGGLGLMLTADHIVASDTARFVSRYAAIGLTPDLGVSTLLPRAVGERRALHLLLTDTTLDAATALDWGLVSEVVPAAEVATRAEQVARFWLANATAAFGHARRLVRAGADREFAANLADEAATIGGSFDTPQARGRIAAFAAGSSRRPARPDEGESR